MARVCEHRQLSPGTFGLVPEARISSGPVMKFGAGFAVRLQNSSLFCDFHAPQSPTMTRQRCRGWITTLLFSRN
jgi:hypothetical protein